MQFGAKSLALFSAMLSAACTNGPPRDNAAAAKTDPPTKTMTIASFQSKCPISDAVAQPQSAIAGALLVAGAGAVIEVGIDLIGSAIRKAGEEKSETVSATPSGYFHKANMNGNFTGHEKLNCLVIAHGSVYQGIADPKWPSTPSLQQNLKTADLYLADTPVFYLEAKLELATTRAAIRYVPVHLSYNKHIGSSWGTNERDLVITAALASPSSDSAGKAFALGTMRFPGLTPPYTTSDSASLQVSATQWMPVAAPDAASTAMLESATGIVQQISKTFGELRPLLNQSDYIGVYETYLSGVKNDEKIAAQKELHVIDQRNKQLKEDNARLTAGLTAEAHTMGLTAAKHIDKKEAEQAKHVSGNISTLRKISDNNAKIFKNAYGTEPYDEQKIKAAHEADLADTLKDKIGNLTTQEKRVFKVVDALGPDGKPTGAKQQLTSFDATPFNALVQVTETRDENKFLLAVADALSKAAPAIKTTLKDALPESAAEKEANLRAAEGLAETALTATQKYDLAVAELSALTADATPVQRLQKEQAVSLALLQANVARRKAGLTALP